MPQLLIPSLTSDDCQVVIEGPTAHHAIRVLRLHVGSQVDLANGRGYQCRGVLTSIDLSLMIGRGDIVHAINSKTWKGQIHLYQGLPRGSKFDFVIEKAAELGVSSITPFLSEKNVIKIAEREAGVKNRRWNAIAESALKQCGSPFLMPVNPVLQFSEVAKRLMNQFALLLDGSSQIQSLSEVLNKYAENFQIHVVVGPESGLTPSEREFALKSQFHLVRLGDRVLRTETAGLVVASILNYEWGNY